MVNGVTGYECAACHSMRLEFCLRDGRVYCQFQPMEASQTTCPKTQHILEPAA
jgi:hypothetical protein